MSFNKKWNYYKHTKPCFPIINKQECPNENCNYAHTLEQYMKAIIKHNFNLDHSIVFQFECLKDDLIPSAKKLCIR
jgi:hypothetical protein